MEASTISQVQGEEVTGCPVMHQDFEWHGRPYATMGAGHLCVDLCQGAVPALLPFLAAERGFRLDEVVLMPANTVVTEGWLDSAIESWAS